MLILYVFYWYFWLGCNMCRKMVQVYYYVFLPGFRNPELRRMRIWGQTVPNPCIEAIIKENQTKKTWRKIQLLHRIHKIYLNQVIPKQIHTKRIPLEIPKKPPPKPPKL